MLHKCIQGKERIDINEYTILGVIWKKAQQNKQENI